MISVARDARRMGSVVFVVVSFTISLVFFIALYLRAMKRLISRRTARRLLFCFFCYTVFGFAALIN